MRRNLLIRPIEVGDLQRILGWRTQPDVARWMFSDHEIAQKEHEAWFDSVVAAPVTSHWVLCLDGSPVGLVNIASSNVAAHRCSLGIYVADASAHGSGVGTGAMLFLLDEALVRRRFEKVTCEAFSDNAAALRLYDSVGFRQEGLFRSHVEKAGRLRDVVVLSMLRPDYEGVRPVLVTRATEKLILEEGQATQ